ncbi:MAG: thiamine pyrophosphate-binding protein [Alphaproteobacteria bacterium]|nr:MAG: thiamine pyrophosphate-binding protein [Alphaproteobacteria bacterium]TMJ91323.1 MAG: thiamine pyrophosphate-binding protein [Alphaproteobacteria bacterium]
MGTNAPAFGSDVIADTLRALEIPFIALNPGASYRGLHDSIVNFLGNETPQMLLCLHEESAVAVAHGYAKVTGKPMAAAVHSNVGLFHATMAIFNAWCDRQPVIVLGATGPVDAVKRRPWIDWIHTARDQGAIVRNYTKWDDQPASPAAAREALLRAAWIASTAPRGPVYVNLDAEMQEAKLPEPLAPIQVARFMPPASPTASAELIENAAAILKAAKHPVMLMGRVSRSVEAWNERVALAETLNAKVISDLKIGCGFPTDHPLHAGAPASNAMVPEAIAAIKAADVILALDWVDLGGALRNALGQEGPKAKIISISADFHVHNGWSMDYEILPPVDLMLPTTPDAAVPLLLHALGAGKPRTAAVVKPRVEKYEPSSGPVRVDDLTRSLKAAVGERDVTLTHLPLSWNGASWAFRHPLDYIGSEGGGGVGGGPGISVGAALALKDSGRLPIAICGDGDFCMGVTALWTAVHYRIPLLVVVCNNRSFFNDELHQERVARIRNRPPENRWIGQRISDPEIDCAGLAAAQGAVGFEPVTRTADLVPTFEKAIAAVEAGQVAVVDVRVEPGYSAVATAAMLRGTEK